MTDKEIKQYEQEMGFIFPDVYKRYLQHMNGLNMPGKNIYGNSGEPHAYRPLYYPYPQDIEHVKNMIAWIYDSFHISPEEAHNKKLAKFIPIISHRFLIIDEEGKYPVLSMHGNDVVPWAHSLPELLLYDVFCDSNQAPNADKIRVRFWCE